MPIQPLSRAERAAAGEALRDETPRFADATWAAPDDRADPVETLEQSNQGRVAELVPIRYGRMLRSPFPFCEARPPMAHDLAMTPTLASQVQACGDCHLLNFGLFATPERNLVFDLNDFDETLPAPWEWDIKRLATSFVTAGRRMAHRRTCGDAAKRAFVPIARTWPSSGHESLEVWYFHICEDTLIDDAPDAEVAKYATNDGQSPQPRRRTSAPKIAEPVDGRHRFVDNPPLSCASATKPAELVDDAIEEVPGDAPRRSTIPLRSLPARRFRPPRRRRRQRRHPLLRRRCSSATT